MFNIFSKQRELKNLKAEIKALNNHIKDLDKFIELSNKKLIDEVAVQEMIIDFNNIDAFSVERCLRDNVKRTVVGFWLRDVKNVKSQHEWHLECNEETHNKIVNAFKDSMKNKD